MSALRRNAVFICAWLLFWALMILVELQDFIRNEHSHALWKPLLWTGSSGLVATLFTLVQLHATRDSDALLATPSRWFARQALWLPLYWIGFTPLAFGMRLAVYALAGETYGHDPWPKVFLYESMKISIFFGLFTAVRFGVQSYRALLDEKLRLEQAAALLRQAQLQRLAQQMQPHFLFNALNTISSLMHSDVELADATLVQLAEVLRATLALGDAHEASLDFELRLARGYAGVMAARFDGRVTIGWEVDEALLGQRLPAMSLQPLIENVFKHTVEQRRGAVRVGVSAIREAGQMVLRVEDDVGTLAPAATGAPAPSSSAIDAPGGIGLANLRARLRALHGERASLSLAARDGGGVRAELRLPCAS
ncbi:sensor histidine kinase [Massilia sp. 9096]|uniref:sensor histidine kinase n=1 Tax=Massilia sp. 9096 TaxID=1500894 RepID=UPI00068B5D97|nr:histidine kinase [Massilia sp. 9096]